MPVITYDKEDLLNLIGKRLSDKELEETINLIKPNVEKITESEIIIEHTADRPDLFGIEGLARAIKNYLRIGNIKKEYHLEQPKLTLRVEKVPIRPYVGAAVARNVNLTEQVIKSLMNLQEVLHETIGRKRKKVAIGIHDLDKISKPISYTQTSRESKILPLDFEEEMTLEEVLIKVPKGRDYGNIISKSKLWPVFIDSKGIFSFPPIINSDRTKVTKDTKNIFIELTGNDKQVVRQTLNIIVTNLAERGADIESVKIQYEKKTEITPNITEEVMELDSTYANKWIGLNISNKEIIEILEKMGYKAIEADKKIEVIIPPYRVDILHPVDLVEDIAIGYGYNNLVPELPNISTVGKPHPLEKLSGKIRTLMIGLGFQEIIQPVLSNFKDQFEKMNLTKRKIVTLLNPVSSEYNCLRISLLPGILKFLSVNKHVDYPQKIFEIGDVVLLDDKEETNTINIRRVAGSIADSRVGFEDIRTVLDNIIKSLGLDYKLVVIKNPSFIEGRVAEVYVKDKKVGILGETHPKVLENWKIEMPVAMFELEIENL